MCATVNVFLEEGWNVEVGFYSVSRTSGGTFLTLHLQRVLHVADTYYYVICTKHPSRPRVRFIAGPHGELE